MQITCQSFVLQQRLRALPLIANPSVLHGTAVESGENALLMRTSLRKHAISSPHSSSGAPHLGVPGASSSCSWTGVPDSWSDGCSCMAVWAGVGALTLGAQSRVSVEVDGGWCMVVARALLRAAGGKSLEAVSRFLGAAGWASMHACMHSRPPWRSSSPALLLPRFRHWCGVLQRGESEEETEVQGAKLSSTARVEDIARAAIFAEWNKRCRNLSDITTNGTYVQFQSGSTQQPCTAATAYCVAQTQTPN